MKVLFLFLLFVNFFPGYRMDHLPFVIAQDKGAEGFQLHGGTIDCSSGSYNPHLAYTCHNGFIRSALLGCNVMLTDHDPGFGGFCVVPGRYVCGILFHCFSKPN